MNKNKLRFLLIAICCLVVALWSEIQCADETRFIDLNFTDSSRTWTAGFSDYSLEQADSIDFTSRVDEIPNLEGKKGYLLAGTNRSDDLFMYITTKYSDLDPDTNYSIKFSNLLFATNVPSDLVGVGGSPGKSVFIKAGSSGFEPRSEEKNGNFRMNIDKGNQSNRGKNAIVMGNFAKTSGDKTSDYEIKEIKGKFNLTPVKTNALGELWILFGTDSGFESRTEIYFISAHAKLKKVS